MESRRYYQSRTINGLGTVDLWHDWTELHFLTEKNQRECYLCKIKPLIKVGGELIIAFSRSRVQKNVEDLMLCIIIKK